jgi:hypothetical protein
MMRECRAFVVMVLFGILSLLCGCDSETHVKRFPVHGTVTMASGEKLNGSITFLPAAGHSGPSATASLVEGQYTFDRTNGPAAGPHQVIITRIVSRADSMKAIAAKQPPKANLAKWTFSAELTDDGPGVQDFTINK